MNDRLDEPTIENSEEEADSTVETQNNNQVNYWLYAAGDEARFWEEFQKDNIMGIGWDYLGDLNQYNSRDQIESAISKNRNDGKKPINNSKSIWDFYKEIKPNDIIYVKSGTKKLIGRGKVTGGYYFDNKASEYRHRRPIKWTDNGNWDLEEKVAVKVLTNLNNNPNLSKYLDSVISGKSIDEKTQVITEFKEWLSQQVKGNGEKLSSNTVNQKVSCLKDLEKEFNLTIFMETDTHVLEDIKNIVLARESYQKYIGVSASAIDYYIRYVETQPTVKESDLYLESDFLSDVFIEAEDSKRLRAVLENKKNLILKGAPGVGKTFLADRLAYLIMEEKDDSRIQMVQFHQSYSYEDFIEGYRPKVASEGFELKQGPFVKFARKAARDPERDYFFIIDEINRGNMSKIFGELMMLIETDKRGKSINLLYSNEKFSVPENLYLIGMMNTADRSIAFIDYALRRRFSFFEISPAFENSGFKTYIKQMDNPQKVLRVIDEVKELNKVIADELGTGFQIGHSYFIGESFKDHNQRIEEVVDFEIIPQLYEYWFDDYAKAEEWENRLKKAYNENV